MWFIREVRIRNWVTGWARVFIVVAGVPALVAVIVAAIWLIALEPRRLMSPRFVATLLASPLGILWLFGLWRRTLLWMEADESGVVLRRPTRSERVPWEEVTWLGTRTKSNERYLLVEVRGSMMELVTASGDLLKLRQVSSRADLLLSMSETLEAKRSARRQ